MSILGRKLRTSKGRSPREHAVSAYAIIDRMIGADLI